MNNCLVCNNELSATEYKFHDSCILCAYCNEPVHKDIVEKLISQEETQVYHIPCHDAKIRADLLKQPVTVTQETLDVLNRALFPFQPNKELTFDTNQMLAINNCRTWFSDMDLDTKFLVLKNLEALAAEMHILIGKDKKYITDLHEKRNLEKFKEKNQVIADMETRKREQADASKRQFERLDAGAKARRNSIEGFMKLLKVDEATATAMVDNAQKEIKK